MLTGFYDDIFEWEFGPEIKRYSWVKPASLHDRGLGATGDEHRYVTLYVQTTNMEVALNTIECNGGLRAFGPQTIPSGAIIACYLGPEGHLIGLVQPPSVM